MVEKTQTASNKGGLETVSNSDVRKITIAKGDRIGSEIMGFKKLSFKAKAA